MVLWVLNSNMMPPILKQILKTEIWPIGTAGTAFACSMIIKWKAQRLNPV